MWETLAAINLAWLGMTSIQAIYGKFGDGLIFIYQHETTIKWPFENDEWWEIMGFVGERALFSHKTMYIYIYMDIYGFVYICLEHTTNFWPQDRKIMMMINHCMECVSIFSENPEYIYLENHLQNRNYIRRKITENGLHPIFYSTGESVYSLVRQK